MKLKISEIKVGDNRREIDESNVANLMKSIREVGLINAITVTQGNKLIAGAHRLEACKRLGWEEIECNVAELDGLKAELAEIDENLIRHNLNHIDEGEQLLRKKEIYEMLYPETKAGGDRKSEKIKRKKLPLDFTGQSSAEETSLEDKKSFVDDSAEKMQLSPRRVRQKIQIARDLTPEVKAIVKERGIGMDASLELARIKEPEKQKEAAEKLAAGIPLDKPEPVKPDYSSIKDSVAQMKNPETGRFVLTAEMFLQEYAATVEDVIRHFEWYKQPMYTDLYPKFTEAELKEVTALNTAMLKAVEKINQMQKGF
ncbi:ParB/RepB/Spo0J family partition protein [Faecalispora jeddahensis]|uniref:ParB/RepB/Spo0J family partition protein n=1 Tax=Faecalispora jeddahensis TaxID=1414721 RepID=UPI00189BD92D|nr:ParB N-terminal domain-containing protein [Faecalispora jeddahensis]